MSNQEWRNYEEDVHLLLGFLRKKLNGDVRPRCIRRIEKTSEDLEIMRRELKAIGGTWRIHRTVNKRSTKKAFKRLQHYMIDNPDCHPYLDSVWKTILLKRECRSEKFFMLDVDTKDSSLVQEAEKLFIDNSRLILKTETPNGFHLIGEPFDTRKADGFEWLTVMKDGYVFLEEVNDG